VCLASSLWGTAAVVIKELYRTTDIDPFAVAFFRLALALPLVAAACGRSLGRPAFKVRGRELSLMMLVGVVLAQYHVCYFAAISFVGVAMASLVTLCSAPILVAIISAILLREKPTSRVLWALALAILGTVCLIGAPETPASWRHTLAGIALSLGSAIGYAAVTLMSRALYARHHPLQTTTFAFAVAVLIIFPLSCCTGISFRYPPRAWMLLLYIGTVSTALAYIMFFVGLQYITATIAAILTMAEPLTATILAWQIFGESLGLVGWIGGGLLMGAIVVLYGSDGAECSDPSKT